MIDPNATAPLQPNSSSWQPVGLYFNPEEAQLDTSKTYALVLQNCPLNDCWLSSTKESSSEHERFADDSEISQSDYSDISQSDDTDYEVGTRAIKPDKGSFGSMVFKAGRWQPTPDTSVALAFYTAGSTKHGYLPNQLHDDWVVRTFTVVLLGSCFTWSWSMHTGATYWCITYSCTVMVWRIPVIVHVQCTTSCFRPIITF